jgi:hypothetical protein
LSRANQMQVCEKRDKHQHLLGPGKDLVFRYGFVGGWVKD